MELKGFQRSYLAKLAHNIKPSVMLGAKGLTEALVNQTDEMLENNELIKVRFVDYKNSRDILSRQLAEATDAELIRVIGNIAILFRQARIPENRHIELPARKS
ncbi:MAG: YhbY family RNA-binding protein [Spirochaetales bacterium]|uniref:YhbY family RNA-binding protein n=1 Tax=Candidatus Thalassospirochaeta sargassi TaxID=3119039 RepID=A0AAJ1IDQ0_9SPIO|nr:YhbY family RNA-binding protein [Spirochaetales bacterium]